MIPANIVSLESQERAMLMSEKQRAYRYGMTLLCIGAFFNWLGLHDHNSDPLKFIGYTCLASGSLLVCLALCMWATTPSRISRNQNLNLNGVERPSISVIENEKPPDYESALAAATPPPDYCEAIKLSPLYLHSLREMENGRLCDEMNSSEVVETATVQVESEVNRQPKEEAAACHTLQQQPSNTTLNKVLRILRRTVSSPDQSQGSSLTPPSVHRSTSIKETR